MPVYLKKIYYASVNTVIATEQVILEQQTISTPDFILIECTPGTHRNTEYAHTIFQR